MKKNCFKGWFCLKAGFTLIELLVVVLIIGILAAVAVPQYQKAVVKSKLATLKAIVDNVAQAAEVYYLANGEHPSTFDQLDVDIPAPISTSYQASNGGGSLTYTYDWGYCILLNYPKVGGKAQYLTGCRNNQAHVSYVRYFTGTTVLPVGAACSVKDDTDKVALAVCKEETGQTVPGYSATDNKVFFYK